MFLGIKRIIKSGFISFWRNGFVTLASIIVMVITLFVMGSLIFLNALLNSSLEEIRQKVDITVYFADSAQEDQILAVQSELENMPEVRQVAYTSREQALEEFRERHEGDEIELQALEVLEENPLRPKLNVNAVDPSQYETISAYLEGSRGAVAPGGTPIVEKVDFSENRVVFDRLTQIIGVTETVGIAVTAFLIGASVLIIFNTIRLAIYTAREEISVMKLVGASNTYIRGPFVFEGLMSGFISAIITLLLFYPITLYLGPRTTYFGNLNIFTYYTQNFSEIFIMIAGAGVLLGAVSSYLAVKKYLKV
jgi:cell division transport system permease protein